MNLPLGLLLSIINSFIGAAVLAHSLCMLNKMHKQTNHAVWFGYILLAVSAFSVAIAPLYGDNHILWSELMFNAGAGLVLIVGWRLQEKQKMAINEKRQHASERTTTCDSATHPD